MQGGISATGLLGIIFVLCKVFEVGPIATWSWWWVLSPFWLPLMLVLLVVAGIFVVAVVAGRK